MLKIVMIAALLMVMVAVALVLSKQAMTVEREVLPQEIIAMLYVATGFQLEILVMMEI